MQRTITQAALKEGTDKEKQAYALINQLRAFATISFSVRASDLTTAASGTLTAAWVSEVMPEAVAWEVTAHVVGRAALGGAGRARYVLEGLFYRDPGGVTTQEGATATLVSIESVAGFGADLAVSGNTVTVRVQDDGTRTMHWSVRVDAREVT